MFATEIASDKKRPYRHVIYALISAACPFIALGLVSLYQAYAYEWFGQLAEQPKPLDDADINAGAMMGFVIVVQATLAIAVGSVFGLVFAAMSLKRRPRILSFGTAALLFNLLPILGVIFVFVRGRI